MESLRLRLKIKKELNEFRIFKKSFKFEMKEIVKKDDGSLFCDEVCIKNGKNNEWVSETDTFINVGYKFHGALPKVLSNLFHCEFYFKGFKLNSIEGVFQGFKFKNKKTQRQVFKHFGLDSNNIKAASDYDWRETQTVYFQGKPIKRNSEEYYDFIDELYISAIQNPLYRNAIKNAGDRYIMHALGKSDITQTIFARCEFEYELNALRIFLNNKEK